MWSCCGAYGELVGCAGPTLAVRAESGLVGVADAASFRSGRRGGLAGRAGLGSVFEAGTEDGGGACGSGEGVSGYGGGEAVWCPSGVEAGGGSRSPDFPTELVGGELVYRSNTFNDRFGCCFEVGGVRLLSSSPGQAGHEW